MRSVLAVRLPSVPGPSDLVAAVSGVREGVSEAFDLVPRIAGAVGRMEALLGRVAALLDRVESIVDRADAAIEAVGVTNTKADAAIDAVAATNDKADAAIDAVAHTNTKADAAIQDVAATNDKADAAIQSVAATNDRADALIATVDRTTARADGIVGTAEGLTGRMGQLVEDYEPALTALGPSVRRLAATFDAQEVEALVTLVDRLPRLVTHLDEDILPVLESLASVGTDVHDLVDTVNDLRQIVKGFPGSRLFRRRGAEEIAQESEQERTAEITGI